MGEMALTDCLPGICQTPFTYLKPLQHSVLENWGASLRGDVLLPWQAARASAYQYSPRAHFRKEGGVPQSGKAAAGRGALGRYWCHSVDSQGWKALGHLPGNTVLPVLWGKVFWVLISNL